MSSARLTALLVLLSAFTSAWAQTIYVPGGTGGIGNNATNGNVGIGTSTPAEQLSLAANQSINVKLNGYSHLGTDYSAWTTIVGQNVRARTGANSGMELASSWTGDGASAMRLGWDRIELHAASSSDITGFSAGSPFSFPRMVIGSNGNVGIGTTSPGYKLEVSAGDTRNIYFDVSGSPKIGTTYGTGGSIELYNGATGAMTFTTSAASYPFVFNTGNVGIGTTSPGYIFSVKENTDAVAAIGRTAIGYVSGLSDYAFISHIDQQSSGSYAMVQDASGATFVNSAAGQGLGFSIGGTRKMVVDAAGNVGIGTNSPTHKLSVNGTVRAKEVIVDTGWADYVFTDDYRLAPLSEVESHIRAKRHLPGIPSAAEVAKDGVSMGHMQAKLLSKVEELTLHLIAQEKRNNEQQAEISALRAELARLSTPN